MKYSNPYDIRMKIAHVITGLNVGGAEMMLSRLVGAMDRHRFENEVISLTDVGPIGRQIQDLGIKVCGLGMSPAIPNPGRILRLAALLREFRPDVVQTWMMHGDLVGGLGAFLAGRVPVVWGVHHTSFDPAHTKWTSKVTLRACRLLAARMPAHVVCCSEASMQICKHMGYPRSKMGVIPNGFDLERLYRDTEGAEKVRAELGIDGSTPVIGLVARFHPQKDHETFFEAAEMLLAHKPGVHFVLCGDGVAVDQPALREKLRQSRSAESFHLLGRRSDLRELMSSFNVATLTSAFGEAFPLVLGEAMCCEVPCVATDVGDTRRIIENTGRVVPRRNPQALQQAWMELLGLSEARRRELGAAARARVGCQFGLGEIAARYQALYEQIGSETFATRSSASNTRVKSAPAQTSKTTLFPLIGKEK